MLRVVSSVTLLTDFNSHDSSKVYTHALRIVGNISCGTDKQTQTIIDCGALPLFAALIKNP